ncbi:hypothetical protein AciX9_4483 (plasmid) [Granulicella tundricola MP5ACTX9]|uniref:Integral membrane protein n=2 Tax=Granulicella TaxID=940557 RepID=E8X7J5_GRATM|nr:hypothetical protein AciX9_4483 [Granulicella tundricola MP5ACTX9]
MNEGVQVLNERTTGQRPPSFVQSMRSANVPRVDARYWSAITVASIFGCNLGDCLSFYAHWNHWIGLAPLAAIFALLLLGERRSTRTTQAWYWTVVIVLRAAATNLADLATHTFEWPYVRVIIGLIVLQMLVVWLVVPRPILPRGSSTGRPSTTGAYWFSLLTAGTLGTAIGDWSAEALHLGTGYATLALGAIFAMVLLIGRESRWTTKLAFWSAIVAVRAAGTTAGDWMAFREEPGLSNGLNLGLPFSTSLNCALYVGLLVLWRPHRGRNSDSL